MHRIAAVLLLIPALSIAQSDAAPDADQEVVILQESRVDFTESLQVDGELLKPNAKLVVQTRRQSFDPLITLRTNFQAEMKHSIDRIK